MHPGAAPPTPHDSGLEARVQARAAQSIEASRLILAKWISGLRAVLVTLFVLWFTVSERWLGSTHWSSSVWILELHALVSTLSLIAVFRSRRYAVISGYLVPAIDVTTTTASVCVLLANVPNPERLVESNVAAFALIIVASHLWFSYPLLWVTAVASIVAQLLIASRVAFDPVVSVNDVVLLVVAATLGTFALRNTLQLKLSAARARELEHTAREQQKHLRSLENQALLAERLATLGTLAAGVAHELNSPLAVIQSGTQWLGAHARPTEEADLPEVIEDMSTAAQRLGAIVQDLRILGHKDTDELRPLDLDEVVTRALRLVLPQLKLKAQVVRETDKAPKVLANETRLAQVLTNLLINAAQAIPEGHAQEHQIRIRVGATATGDARIEVIDTGEGMSAHVQEHLFEPFFTTKPEGIGTGLGLAIIKRIVDSLAGSIAVESQPGRGTRFEIAIPAFNARSVA